MPKFQKQNKPQGESPPENTGQDQVAQDHRDLQSKVSIESALQAQRYEADQKRADDEAARKAKMVAEGTASKRRIIFVRLEGEDYWEGKQVEWPAPVHKIDAMRDSAKIETISLSRDGFVNIRVRAIDPMHHGRVADIVASAAVASIFFEYDRPAAVPECCILRDNHVFHRKFLTEGLEAPAGVNEAPADDDIVDQAARVQDELAKSEPLVAKGGELDPELREMLVTAMRNPHIDAPRKRRIKRVINLADANQMARQEQRDKRVAANA